MSYLYGIAYLLACAIVYLVVRYVVTQIKASRERARIEKLKPLERIQENALQASRNRDETLGAINPVMICPHCQTKGKVRAKTVLKKAGVSGSKASAAVLTGGASILVAGLSQEDECTAASCDECGSHWTF